MGLYKSSVEVRNLIQDGSCRVDCIRFGIYDFNERLRYASCIVFDFWKVYSCSYFDVEGNSLGGIYQRFKQCAKCVGMLSSKAQCTCVKKYVGNAAINILYKGDLQGFGNRQSYLKSQVSYDFSDFSTAAPPGEPWKWLVVLAVRLIAGAGLVAAGLAAAGPAAEGLAAAASLTSVEAAAG